VKAAIVFILAAITAGPALAQAPAGCDKFKWPLDKERATLTGTDLPKVVSGDRVPWPIPFATIFALLPIAQAKLPMPPERTPTEAGLFAGFIQVAAHRRSRTYKITLSADGWIDVIQDGRPVKSSASSGATDCEGVRKSVKFNVSARPFTVQLSGVRSNLIKIAISED
jgi:hypothetical protein